MRATVRFSPWLGAIALVGLVPAAHAQSTRERLDSLETRLTQLEAVLQGAALVELSQGVAAQDTELRALRGELETLQQGLATVRREQAAFAADVDRRLTALESRATTVAPAPISAAPATEAPPAETLAAEKTPAAVAAPPAVDPGVLYGQGFDALKAGRYGEAIETLKAFRVHYPEHPLADNAAYWLGQSYYVSREYALALEAFAAVGDRSADPGKAPDAWLKKGLCELELRRPEAARASFEAVITRYPDSESARQAREQLDRLR